MNTRNFRNPSTKGEIIDLLLANKLPDAFTWKEVHALLPHRSQGAISGALSWLTHDHEVLKTWKEGKTGFFKLRSYITTKDLTLVPYSTEKQRPFGLARASTSIYAKKIEELKNREQTLHSDCTHRLERILTTLAEVERGLLTLAQEMGLDAATRTSKPKVPVNGVASSLHNGHNLNRGQQ